jgi:hypothetical protein
MGQDITENTNHLGIAKFSENSLITEKWLENNMVNLAPGMLLRAPRGGGVNR